MIQITNLRKSFGKLAVLQEVSVRMGTGKVYAFLGPNASGKTTLIKSILGLVTPDSGEIMVAGESIHHHWRYKKRIGYMPQIARFPENLTLNELIQMTKDLRQMPSDEETYLRHFDLGEARHQKLKNLSGGTKQKANAVLAFMFNPDILIFDEPSVGLDPVSRLRLKGLIAEEREKGKTILLTTHILSEVEELTDEVIFLMDGTIYFQGPLQDLLLSQEETNLERAIVKITQKKTVDKDKRVAA